MKTILLQGICVLTICLIVLAGGCATDTPVADTGGGSGTDNGGNTVSLSGRLTVITTGVVDGDTNDPTNAVIPNDGNDLSEVQDMPNPGVAGGFLGVVGQSADAFDIYRVQMAAGQSAALLLADPSVNDFDLFLFDESANLLDSSEGVGRAEQVIAPTNGTLLVQVFGYSVANDGDLGGLYTLLVGRSAATVAMAPGEKLSSLYPHVAGEVIVRYTKDSVSAKKAMTTRDFDFEVVDTPPNSTGIHLVRTKRHARKSNGANRFKALPASSGAPFLHNPPSEVIASIKQLRRQSDVAWAEPNYLRVAQAVPNDEFYGLQWHYPQIGLPDAWDVTTGDPSVIVAVIDSGVVLDHPDLQGQLVSGYDMISDPSMSRDGDGMDPDPNDPGDLNIQGIKSSFHGTHVAGTIAANTNNGFGVAGVAWGVKVMPVRVLGNGGGTDFDIIQGILFAAGLENSSGALPARAADIINMSLGGPGFSQPTQDAINAARAAGVIVIVASGNDATDANNFTPAGLDGVVAVSAVGFNGGIAPYSNFGSAIDVASPGGDTSVDDNGDGYPDGVLSSIGQDDGSFTYDFFQGTSMASPHMAGVVALMKSVNPNLSPDDLDQLLAGTHPGTNINIVDDFGPAGRDDSYGYGLINALGAVRAASDIIGVNAAVGPVMRVVPHNVDLGPDTTSVDIVVDNTGGETLSVTGVTTNETWLSVSPTSGGAGTYRISVDRTGLADGIYSGTVSFASNGGSASVAVRMGVGAQGASGGDIGTIYILVIDLETGTPVGQFNATAADGYAFAFDSLPAGVYGIFAGTDMDNDSFIDNEGEALGGFPTLVEADLVDLTQNRSGLSFNVSYQINVQVPSSAQGLSTDGRSPQSDRLRLRRIR